MIKNKYKTEINETDIELNYDNPNVEELNKDFSKIKELIALGYKVTSITGGAKKCFVNLKHEVKTKE
jgi:hypothetical protein